MVSVGSAVLGLDVSLIKGIQQLEKEALSVTLTDMHRDVKGLLSRVPAVADKYQGENVSWIGNTGLLALVVDEFQIVLSQLQAWFKSDNITLAQMTRLAKILDQVSRWRQQMESEKS